MNANTNLLRQAREGSQDALNELFEDLAPRLLSFIRMRLGPDLRGRIESEDILQITLLKAFSNLESFEGSGSSSLGGWLAAIARNEIRDQVDYFRRQRRDVTRQVPLGSGIENIKEQLSSVVSRLQVRERQHRLESALEDLKPEHREVILLRQYEELSFPEIGERLGKSPDACRMLLARAIAALSRAMGDQT
jgi:RNA polymerase sigma-70 factor, ECF subfamily